MASCRSATRRATSSSTSRDNWTYGYYTIEGRQIFFGGTPDAVNGTDCQIAYYGEVPVFADTQQSWVYTKYPSLYLSAALMHAYLHAVGEEQKAGNKAAHRGHDHEAQRRTICAPRRAARASPRSRIRSFG